jgi:hypothetical protein
MQCGAFEQAGISRAGFSANGRRDVWIKKYFEGWCPPPID